MKKWRYPILAFLILLTLNGCSGRNSTVDTAEAKSAATEQISIPLGIVPDQVRIVNIKASGKNAWDVQYDLLHVKSDSVTGVYEVSLIEESGSYYVHFIRTEPAKKE